MINEAATARALQRIDFFIFVVCVFRILHPGEEFLEAWHVEAICHALQEVAEGRVTRQLVTVPPRHLKSICASVALTAWILGRDPTKKILAASYGNDLAENHARDTIKVMKSAWYKRLFPRTKISVRDGTIYTSQGGFRRPVSMFGAVTGFGADFLIIDDLMKADHAYSEVERQRVRDHYEGTLLTRLNDKGKGGIVVIQQRLHEDDLPGYLLRTGTYRHLNLQSIAEQDEQIPLYDGRIKLRRRGEALFPERESLEVLERMRRDMGSAKFEAQHQQNPVPPDGNRLRVEWFPRYSEPPRREALQYVTQSWDTAMRAEPTSNYSVCTTWGLLDNKWYLLDVFRQRLDFPDLKRAAIEQRRFWRADRVLIEDAASGTPLIDQLRHEGHAWVQAWSVRDSKEVRFEAQTAMIEAGEVVLPDDAPWLHEFLHEIRAFPNGRYNDQVDSMVQFLDWSRSPQADSVRIARDPRTGRPVRFPRPQSFFRPD